MLSRLDFVALLDQRGRTLQLQCALPQLALVPERLVQREAVSQPFELVLDALSSGVNFETMFASHLPYQSAFAQVPLPAVPKDLERRVAELASVATASYDSRLAGAGAHQVSGRFSGPSSGAKLIAMWLLLAGLVVGYLAATRVPQWASPSTEPWVRKVSSYHSMYSRETVVDDGAGLAQAAALKARLLQQGLALRIPDLSAQGLRFVRAQQLQFDGKMVLQIVYLPSVGVPLALCLTPAPAQPERAVTLDGLQAVTWQSGAWAYVLIGGLPMAQLQTIRLQIPSALI